VHHDREGRGEDWLMEVWSRRKWLAIGVFLMTAAAGFAVARSVPNVYQATATVLVEEPASESAVSRDLDRRLQSLTQEILSRSRLAELIASLDLYPRLRQKASPEALVARMRRDIRTEFKALPAGGAPASTLAFTLSYRGGRPETTARVANALASFYLEEDAKIRERQAGATVQLLKSQLDEMEGKLQQQNRKMAAYQAAHPSDLPQSPEVSLAALGQLHAELRSSADERIRALERRNDLLRRLGDLETGLDPVSVLAGRTSAVAPSGPSRLARLNDELADLQRRYTDKYPDVVRVKAEIDALEARAEAADVPPAVSTVSPASELLRSRGTARAKDELAQVEEEIRTLRADEGALRGQINGYIQRMEAAPLRQQGYQELSRDYETTRDLYDTLRKQYQQAQLAEGAEGAGVGPKFRILDPASVPVDPIAPNRFMLLILTVAAALGLAAGAALVAERMDTSFHAADDVRKYTRVPVLASIPLIQTDMDIRAQRRRFLVVTAAVLVALGLVTHTFQGLARSEEGFIAALANGRS